MSEEPFRRDHDERSALFQYCEKLGIPMLGSSAEGTVCWINRAMEQLSGEDGRKLEGASLRFLIRSLVPEIPEEQLDLLLSGGGPIIAPLKTPGPEERWVEISASPLQTGSEGEGRVFAFREISGKEYALGRKNAIEGLITTISGSILSGVTGPLGERVQEIVEELARRTGSSRCRLFLSGEGDAGSRRELAWSSDSAHPSTLPPGVAMFDFSWTAERMRKIGAVHTLHPGHEEETVVVPVLGSSMKGFLSFESADSRTVSAALPLLRVAGEMIAAATELRGMEDTLARRDGLFESVMRASGTLLKSADWEEAIGEVLDTLGPGTGVDRVYIMEEATAPRYWEWISGAEYSASDAHPASITLWSREDLAPWKSALALGHILVGTTAKLPPNEAIAFAGFHIRTFAIIPIFVQERCWGYIGFDSCRNEREWANAEIEALKTVTDSIGNAIAQKNREIDISDRNRQLSIINEVITSAGNASSIEALTATILEKTLFHIHAKRGAVYLLNPDAGYAERRCIVGEEEDGIPLPPVLRPDHALFGRIFVNGERVCEVLDSEGVINWIPLKAGNTPVGGMVLVSDGRSLQEFESRTLEAIGREFGAAIDKMLLQQALKDSYEKANLYLDIMSHDIKNATTVSIMYADMLREMLEGEPREFADKLMESVRRTVEITEHVSTIRRLHEERPVLKSMDLDDLILREIAQHPGVRIHYTPTGYKVMADDLVHEIFANLVGNSIKYGGDEVEIFLRVQPAGDLIEVTVEDTGPGISDAEKNKIFERFGRGESKKSGKGLGLYIVRMLVKRYGGFIAVSDRIAGHPEHGAAFRFTFPRGT
ncbi:MAG: ATP-binding protein [Methanomicrobiaceae archaeon]|nr:ATP-binding protein [Methanomicrobiaceae archaeon]